MCELHVISNCQYEDHFRSDEKHLHRPLRSGERTPSNHIKYKQSGWLEHWLWAQGRAAELLMDTRWKNTKWALLVCYVCVFRRISSVLIFILIWGKRTRNSLHVFYICSFSTLHFSKCIVFGVHSNDGEKKSSKIHIIKWKATELRLPCCKLREKTFSASIRTFYLLMTVKSHIAPLWWSCSTTLLQPVEEFD